MSEIVAVIGINKVNNNRSRLAYLTLAGGFISSFLLLSQAMNDLPMGTAYAVWTGIGTAGSTLIGMLVYGESKDWRRVLFIGIVASAAVGLKLLS
jgi:paired small multidrug resistance pump